MPHGNQSQFGPEEDNKMLKLTTFYTGVFAIPLVGRCHFLFISVCLPSYTSIRVRKSS